MNHPKYGLKNLSQYNVSEGIRVDCTDFGLPVSRPRLLWVLLLKSSYGPDDLDRVLKLMKVFTGANKMPLQPLDKFLAPFEKGDEDKEEPTAKKLRQTMQGMTEKSQKLSDNFRRRNKLPSRFTEEGRPFSSTCSSSATERFTPRELDVIDVGMLDARLSVSGAFEDQSSCVRCSVFGMLSDFSHLVCHAFRTPQSRQFFCVLFVSWFRSSPSKVLKRFGEIPGNFICDVSQGIDRKPWRIDAIAPCPHTSVKLFFAGDVIPVEAMFCLLGWPCEHARFPKTFSESAKAKLLGNMLSPAVIGALIVSVVSTLKIDAATDFRQAK